MVIAFVVLMVRRGLAMAEENQRLREHLQEKTEHLQKLLTERGQLIAELEHDMKSPLTSLSNMARIIRLEPVELNTFLLDFYHNCRPIIELYGPNFLEKITSWPCHVMANRNQLFRALENLLYNTSGSRLKPGSPVKLKKSAKKQRTVFPQNSVRCLLLL